jgi:hypothetical protein
MEHTRIPLQAYKNQPTGKRDIGRPRRRWRATTILEAGTGDFPNPCSDGGGDDDDVGWEDVRWVGLYFRIMISQWGFKHVNMEVLAPL